MTELPDKPSELIRLALTDLRKVEASPLYRIDMNQWHTPGERQCEVCMAGAVIAMTLGIDPSVHLYPDKLPEPTKQKLEAINQFRIGEIDGGLYVLGIEDYPEGVPVHMPVPCYSHVQPGEFHERMEKMAAILEGYGL